MRALKRAAKLQLPEKAVANLFSRLFSALSTNR